MQKTERNRRENIDVATEHRRGVRRQEQSTGIRKGEGVFEFAVREVDNDRKNFESHQQGTTRFVVSKPTGGNALNECLLSDYITELNNFYPILSCWASTEPELCPILHSLALTIEKNSFANSDLVAHQPTVVNTPIREFLTYIECVKEVLNKRDNYQLVYENSVEELAKKRNEKENVRIRPRSRSSFENDIFSS